MGLCASSGESIKYIFKVDESIVGQGKEAQQLFALGDVDVSNDVNLDVDFDVIIEYDNILMNFDGDIEIKVDIVANIDFDIQRVYYGINNFTDLRALRRTPADLKQAGLLSPDARITAQLVDGRRFTLEVGHGFREQNGTNDGSTVEHRVRAT